MTDQLVILGRLALRYIIARREMRRGGFHASAAESDRIMFEIESAVNRLNSTEIDAAIGPGRHFAAQVPVGR